MPRLVYIDEQADQRRAIVRSAILSQQFADGEVFSLDPLPELDDMIAAIEDMHPEVILTDYQLREYKAGIKYSGIDLVAAWQQRYEDFPCFVTTGFANDAAGEAASNVDINAIYSKRETTATVNDADDTLGFFKRVRLKAEAYRMQIETLEKKHASLQAKLVGGYLSPAEVEELLEIDGDLEAMLGAEHKMPDELKRAALAPLNQIIEKAEQLLSDLEEIYPDTGAAKNNDA